MVNVEMKDRGKNNKVIYFYGFRIRREWQLSYTKVKNNTTLLALQYKDVKDLIITDKFVNFKIRHREQSIYHQMALC